MLGRNKKR